MSRPNSDRMAAAYSARLSRWNTRRPGFGLAAAAASSRRFERRDERHARAHRRLQRRPSCGISPARSLRTIFSPSSGRSPTFATSKLASVRLFCFGFSSWHSTQDTSR